MTTTPQTEAGTGAGGTQAVALQLSELVLKTARYEDMADFSAHVLGHGPFYERIPDPDAPPTCPSARSTSGWASSASPTPRTTRYLSCSASKA
ncbi:hypothetical protein [Streptomyces europaeiscabiei]|uniref:hypothetical protein n=1 Tax=Streptomyces europaeiscabiei TaxID=146819 RepID=UPI002E179FB3|nr:hypothetical protein OG858_01740 [Streptomyces europaeiscabiei]